MTPQQQNFSTLQRIAFALLGAVMGLIFVPSLAVFWVQMDPQDFDAPVMGLMLLGMIYLGMMVGPIVGVICGISFPFVCGKYSLFRQRIDQASVTREDTGSLYRNVLRSALIWVTQVASRSPSRMLLGIVIGSLLFGLGWEAVQCWTLISLTFLHARSISPETTVWTPLLLPNILPLALFFVLRRQPLRLVVGYGVLNGSLIASTIALLHTLAA